jgi:adenosylcobinamide-phosphate synthase
MILAPDVLVILLLALVIDAMIGDPDAAWRRIPHPVVLVGRLVDACDRLLNRDALQDRTRQLLGIVALSFVVAASVAAALVVEMALRLAPTPVDVILLGVVASIFIAQRSLYLHVARVRHAFADGGLPAARRAVSQIVGRDSDALDEAGVCRAAIESCAENYADGVVAPAFWCALLGLPGLVAYKAINTADSMIGHRTLRHEAFGWAAARLDDLVNTIPARLSGTLIAFAGLAAGGSPARALHVMWRDAPRHRSPNAGWPESAMAAGLGVALAGPRSYAGRKIEDGYMNEGGRIVAKPSDIAAALRVFVAACALHAMFYAGLTLALR